MDNDNKDKDLQLKVRFLSKELELLNQRVKDQIKITNSYKELLNGRTDLKQLMSASQLEQQLLQLQNEKLIKERNEAVAKSLILDQIINATQEENHFVMIEAETRIQQLKEQIFQLEQNETKFVQPSSLNSGYIIHYKVLTDLNTISLKLSQQIEDLNQQLIQKDRIIHRLKESKQDLIQLNFALSNQIAKKIITQQSVEDIDKYMQNLINAQKRLIQLDLEESEKDCLSPLSDRVILFKQKSIEGIPKLDLRKAQQIQAVNLKHIQEKQQINQLLNPTEELLKWIQEYKELKTQYDSINLFNKQLIIQIDEQERKLKDLLSTNSIIINANKRLEQKVDKLQSYLSTYQQFYAENNTSKIEKESEMKQHQIQPTSYSDIKMQLIPQQSFDNSTNYRDKMISLSKDVAQLGKKDKQDNISEEDIPQAGDIKRGVKNYIGNKQYYN